MKYAPKFPPENPARPYPSEARQHAMCLLALSTIRVFCGDVYPHDLPASTRKRMGQIIKQLEAVRPALERKLSAGAKRDIGAAFDKIVQKCAVQEMVDGETDVLHWCDAVYLAHLLLADCRAVCPAYYKGDSWGWLYHHLECLADWLEERAPGTAMEAGDIHLEVAL